MICSKCKSELTKIVTFCPYCKWDQRLDFNDDTETDEPVIKNDISLPLSDALKIAVAEVLNQYQHVFDAKGTIYFVVKPDIDDSTSESYKPSEINIVFNDGHLISPNNVSSDNLHKDHDQIKVDEKLEYEKPVIYESISKTEETLIDQNDSIIGAIDTVHSHEELQTSNHVIINEEPIIKKQASQVLQPSIDYSKKSYFNGGLLGMIGIRIITTIILVFTLGLALPWTIVIGYRWKVEHTYIHGKRLYFDGKGGQLFGSYIKWVFFSFITFGIYLLFIPIKIEQWKAKHTHFHDYNESSVSRFNGSTFGLIGINILTALLFVMTVGIALPWIISIRMNWFSKHQVIDGYTIRYDGQGIQLFGNYIKWILIAGITFGIYVLWIPIKFKKWVTKHQYIQHNDQTTEKMASSSSTVHPNLNLSNVQSLKIVDDNKLETYFNSKNTMFSTDIAYKFKSIIIALLSLLLYASLNETRLIPLGNSSGFKITIMDMIISNFLGNSNSNNFVFIGTNYPITIILFSTILVFWIVVLLINLLGIFLKIRIRMINFIFAVLIVVMSHIITELKDVFVIMVFDSQQILLSTYNTTLILTCAYIFLVINILFLLTKENTVNSTYMKIQKMETASRLLAVKKVNKSLIRSLISIILNIILFIGVSFFIGYINFRNGSMSITQNEMYLYASIMIILYGLISLQMVIMYSLMEMKLRLDPNHIPALFLVFRVLMAMGSYGLIILFSTPFVQYLKQKTFRESRFKTT